MYPDNITSDEQLERWVAGESIHRRVDIDGEASIDECVPDFSCCKPELLQPAEVRRAFIAMALAGGEHRVHIAGAPIDEPS